MRTGLGALQRGQWVGTITGRFYMDWSAIWATGGRPRSRPPRRRPRRDGLCCRHASFPGREPPLAVHRRRRPRVDGPRCLHGWPQRRQLRQRHRATAGGVRSPGSVPRPRRPGDLRRELGLRLGRRALPRWTDLPERFLQQPRHLRQLCRCHDLRGRSFVRVGRRRRARSMRSPRLRQPRRHLLFPQRSRQRRLPLRLPALLPRGCRLSRLRVRLPGRRRWQRWRNLHLRVP